MFCSCTRNLQCSRQIITIMNFYLLNRYWSIQGNFSWHFSREHQCLRRKCPVLWNNVVLLFRYLRSRFFLLVLSYFSPKILLLFCSVTSDQQSDKKNVSFLGVLTLERRKRNERGGLGGECMLTFYYACITRKSLLQSFSVLPFYFL